MIDIERVDTLDNDWRAFLSEYSSNSFFCSPEFTELWQTMDGRPVYWIVTDSGTRAAILPAVVFGRSVLTRLQSMPEGCYGRFIVHDEHAGKRAEYWSALIDILLNERFAKIFLYDFYDTMPTDSRLLVQRLTTTVVDLSNDWQPPGREERRVMRKAEEDGAVMRPFDSGQHLDSFMKIMNETEARHGRKPRYTREFFRALGQLSQTDDRVVWRVCEFNQDLIASYICFEEIDMIFYWQAYYNEIAMKHRASDFLVGRIALEAAARGMKQMNLGSTPGDIESVKQWKAKWGGCEHRYSAHSLRSTLGKFI